jgi:hypothetical protein
MMIGTNAKCGRELSNFLGACARRTAPHRAFLWLKPKSGRQFWFLTTIFSVGGLLRYFLLRFENCLPCERRFVKRNVPTWIRDPAAYRALRRFFQTYAQRGDTALVRSGTFMPHEIEGIQRQRQAGNSDQA